MVGVLTMAAAAAPPPVKDFEIEVRICQVPFCPCWGIVAWGWWESCLLLGRERRDTMTHSYNFVWNSCLGVRCKALTKALVF